MLDPVTVRKHHSGRDSSSVVSLEASLAAARPRLLRLAQAYGVPIDATDDVVQETLIAAWRNLEQLRTPAYFDAWIASICHNAARLYLRKYERQRQEHDYSPTSTSILFAEQNDTDRTFSPDVPDLLGCDPLEEVERQEVAALLKQALEYLPSSMRQMVEAYYLAEQPQRDIALQLGLTMSALEARLHRARNRLRQILNGPLRSKMHDLELPLSAALADGWRETHEWCTFCGRRHLYGSFEHWPQGGMNLRLRCPECASRYGVEELNSKGLVPLEKRHSFRPARKRTMQTISSYSLQSLAAGQRACLFCGTQAPVHVLQAGEGKNPLPNKFWLGADCPTCGFCGWPADMLACYPSLAMHEFMKQHPRWVRVPDRLIAYGNQAAIRFRFQSLSSSASIVFLAHPQTLEILTTYQDERATELSTS